eukprot:m.48071 g.48071  ORF g.48071 m.48071 type:complete len:272 (+) comp10550_c0_seq1:170-985(+)
MSTRRDTSEFELTEYELQRLPHSPIMNDTVVRLHWNELNDQLKCPVCLSILTSTMTTKDCLHRFCSECISKALRMNKKECPTCRNECPSKRSLRQDDNFDKLISIIFPDRQVLESRHQELMVKIKQYNNPTSNIEIYSSQPVKRQKIERSIYHTTLTRASPVQKKTSLGSGETQIEVILKSHPLDGDLLDHDLYITTLATCTAYHIAKFVAVHSPGNLRIADLGIYAADESKTQHSKISPNETLREILASTPSCWDKFILYVGHNAICKRG